MIALVIVILLAGCSAIDTTFCDPLTRKDCIALPAGFVAKVLDEVERMKEAEKDCHSHLAQK